MNILDSKNVNNVVKIRSIVIAIVIYLMLGLSTLGLAAILLGIAAGITTMLYNKEIKLISANSNKFKKTYPLKYFGESFGDFEHVFYHKTNIEQKIVDRITSDLSEKANLTMVEKIDIVDVDPDLKSPEKRTFIKIDSGSTNQGTNITLVLKTSSFEKMQSIQWWTLAGGFIDKNKKFNKAAYSLFTLPFWIIPYIKKNHDLLPSIRTIHSGYYNHQDVLTKVKGLHDIVFQAMVDELEQHDIDTSEIKTQKMQVMNIKISGGKVNMGNIVQGGMNKISSRMTGAK